MTVLERQGVLESLGATKGSMVNNRFYGPHTSWNRNTTDSVKTFWSANFVNVDKGERHKM